MTRGLELNWQAWYSWLDLIIVLDAAEHCPG